MCTGLLIITVVVAMVSVMVAMMAMVVAVVVAVVVCMFLRRITTNAAAICTLALALALLQLSP